MNGKNDKMATRRGFLAGTAGLMAAAGSGFGAVAAEPTAPANVMSGGGQDIHKIEPFWGRHQGGIATRQQTNSYFAAFDLATDKRDDVASLLRVWSLAAERMTAGQTAAQLSDDTTVPASDSGDALSLPAARLTLTFGFGQGLFSKEGRDRYQLAERRPEALGDLPKFPGDQLVEEHTGGDLSIQACADDPQVAFHAVRQLARLADGTAQIRWAQTGFAAGPASKGTGRNLMGFKDGTINPTDFDRFVWVGNEGPDWMRGGSYLVTRRIRIALEHWEKMTVAFQESVVGRHKYSGAPLGGKHEFDPLNLDANDQDGNPINPENSHVRLSAPEVNDGAQILRRAYSYNDGLNFTAERWPPWRQGNEYDAGLFFVSYQRDPRTGFIPIHQKLSRMDAMNQFTTHVGGGLFACPGGTAKGEFIGQRLFDRT
ncbi:iron uptake transporter deferrochelatase/peroxidase subunit [Telmatospirillum sp.]|uniref:iron uptake transporter deferrochelatase/peroxidase subunit n=1 Tax=Telmatospirillum sp. TaxID=2079197 RepID=UPI00283DDC67|nr:iron uptake transporter deferrochelatase/peroxidase subunit [Telmatospirillum sp.]MDR3438294.1 iron uptake transporter deferrochelatase/peroxidase subunit [Telmatospirillum sp.]